MSRTARAPDDQTKLKKKLNDLMKLEGNKFCADCGCRGPRWASINLGVFICIACSGIHRSLGVHLTFVRSVNLDSWTLEQVQQMQRWGNARAKEHYEANTPPDYRIPTEHSSVREKEMWIRDKYERKRFVGEAPRSDKRQEDRARRRKKQHSEDEEDNGEEERRLEKAEARQSSRTASQESIPTAATADILSFDVFSPSVPVAPPAAPPIAPPSAPPVAAPTPTMQPKQDEWASFGGSTNTQSGFQGAFATQSPPPTDQHVNKMANIMASFGSNMQQQPLQQQNGFMSQHGMTSLAPMMGGMQMPMMHPRPMGMSMPMSNMPMSMPMSSMPMGGQGFTNPMMGQLPNTMMGYPMPNQSFCPPQQNGMMMGVAAPMGFQGQSMGMNPMGMQMNRGGFPPQQQHQQQPQQQHQQPQPQVGGLSQPFVNFG